MHYYDFNIADYRKDTAHLKPIEHYIYRTLIDWYYLDETPIPKITQVVMRRLSLGSDDDQKALLNVLGDFFDEQDDGFHHLKIDSIIESYHFQNEKNRENGKKGGRPPKNNPNQSETKPKQNPSVISDNPNQSETNPNQEPITNNHKPITKNQSHTDGQILEQPQKSEKTVRVESVEILDAVPVAASTNSPTLAAAVCVALRANGAGATEVSPSNPKFIKLIAAGATIDHFVDAFAKAKDAGAGKPFAYMLSVVDGELQAASNIGNARASPSGLPPNKQEKLEQANKARAQAYIDRMG